MTVHILPIHPTDREQRAARDAQLMAGYAARRDKQAAQRAAGNIRPVPHKPIVLDVVKARESMKNRTPHFAPDWTPPRAA